jgi:hypothetical protein
MQKGKKYRRKEHLINNFVAGGGKQPLSTSSTVNPRISAPRPTVNEDWHLIGFFKCIV